MLLNENDTLVDKNHNVVELHEANTRLHDSPGLTNQPSII